MASGLTIPSQRKGSISDLFDGEFLGLNHTPPQFTPSSYETGHVKRMRSGSISGRLRSASELEERGVIDRGQKGALKNLIMSGDEALISALDKFAFTGDATDLRTLLQSGVLEGETELDIDLLVDDLDLNFLQLQSGLSGFQAGSLGSVPQGLAEDGYQFDIDDMAAYDPAGYIDDEGILAAIAEGAEEEVPASALLKGMSPSTSLLGMGMSPLDTDAAFLGTVKPEPPSDVYDRSMPPPASKSIASFAGKRLGIGSKVRANFIRGEAGAIKSEPPSEEADEEETEAGEAGMTREETTANNKATQHHQQRKKCVKIKTEPIITTRRGSGAGAAASSGASATRATHGAASAPIYTSLKAEEGGAVSNLEGKHLIGAYSPESRRRRLEKFWEKKKNRIWDRKVKYDVRKNFADSRIRVKGRFVKKEDEAILFEVGHLVPHVDPTTTPAPPSTTTVPCNETPLPPSSSRMSALYEERAAVPPQGLH